MRNTGVGSRGVAVIMIYVLWSVERPHLISDARISERLPNLPATSNIITSHVVLLLNKNIYKFLWSSIESHLYKRSLLLSKISKVSGEYIIRNDQISLKSQSVSLKASGKKIVLKDVIRTWLWPVIWTVLLKLYTTQKTGCVVRGTTI